MSEPYFESAPQDERDAWLELCDLSACEDDTEAEHEG